MTLWQALAMGTAALEATSGESARFEAWQLLAHGMGLARLPLSLDASLSPAQEAAYRESLERRLAGEPLQYILGQWEFMGLPFYVGPEALIPRPDTEALCEAVLARRPKGRGVKLLDLCCGTGCIGLSLGKLGGFAPTLTDISPQCLALAKASAEVTHDHPDGIAGACAVAGAVYLARTGADKAAIADHVTRYYPLGFTLDEIRDAYQFDVSCAGSVPQAMEAFLEAESFEDAVRNAISIGGDSDTIACMAGSVAAAFFGIPKDIREAAQPFLEGEVKRVYQAFIQRY